MTAYNFLHIVIVVGSVLDGSTFKQESIEWWTATCFKQWISQNIAPFVVTLLGRDGGWSFTMSYAFPLNGFANLSTWGDWWLVFPVF